VPFQYQLAPTLDSAPLLLHIAAAVLAVSLAVAASSRVGNWVGRVLAAAAVMQAATGGLMYLGATEDAWAPGPQTALHTVSAHVMATTSAVAYIKKR
jgi:cytochrome b